MDISSEMLIICYRWYEGWCSYFSHYTFDDDVVGDKPCLDLHINTNTISCYKCPGLIKLERFQYPASLSFGEPDFTCQTPNFSILHFFGDILVHVIAVAYWFNINVCHINKSYPNRISNHCWLFNAHNFVLFFCVYLYRSESITRWWHQKTTVQWTSKASDSGCSKYWYRGYYWSKRCLSVTAVIRSYTK